MIKWANALDSGELGSNTSSRGLFDISERARFQSETKCKTSFLVKKRVSFLYSFAHGFAWRFHALPFFFSSDEFLTEILSVKRIILVLDQIFRRSLCSHPKVSSNEKWAEFGECAVTLIRRHCQLKINLYCSVYVRFRADLSFNWLASVGWYGGKYDSETKHNLVQYMELCAHLTANFSADKSNQKASLSCVKK